MFIVWRIADDGRVSVRYLWKECVGGPWNKDDAITGRFEEGMLVLGAISIEVNRHNARLGNALGRFPLYTRRAVLTKVAELQEGSAVPDPSAGASGRCP